MSCERIALGLDWAPALDAATAVLRRSGIVAFPTETVYGLGVASMDEDAAARLRICKGRDGDKPFQILIADRQQVERFAREVDDMAKRLMDAFWPGPMTLILPGRYEDTVGLRLPDHPFVQAFARAAGGAIVATSANASGLPPASNADEVAAAGLTIDLLIDGGRISSGQASTVVLYRNGAVRILREGGIAAEDVYRIVPKEDS